MDKEALIAEFKFECIQLFQIEDYSIEKARLLCEKYYKLRLTIKEMHSVIFYSSRDLLYYYQYKKNVFNDSNYEIKEEYLVAIVEFIFGYSYPKLAIESTITPEDINLYPYEWYERLDTVPKNSL